MTLEGRRKQPTNPPRQVKETHPRGSNATAIFKLPLSNVDEERPIVT